MLRYASRYEPNQINPPLNIETSIDMKVLMTCFVSYFVFREGLYKEAFGVLFDMEVEEFWSVQCADCQSDIDLSEVSEQNLFQQSAARGKITQTQLTIHNSISVLLHNHTISLKFGTIMADFA